MTDREPSSTPPLAPPLELPPAELHDVAAEAPHPDSEEFRQKDRWRVARELDTIDEGEPHDPASSLHLSPNAPSAFRSPTIRPRASSRRAGSLHAGASRPVSEVSTAADSEGPDAHDVRRTRLCRQVPHWYDPVVKFWTTHISVSIDEGSHRDHLALERTFLGYLRTSLTLVMTGVVTAQLFRLQHSTTPNMEIGFFVLGIPLALTFICSGMIVLVIGAFRFWRQQSAMIRGKVHCGGWDIIAIMALSIILCVSTFLLATTVDIEKSYF